MNDRADRLAGKATLTSGLLLGRSEALRSLRHYLRAQSQGQHTIDRLGREARKEEALDDLLSKDEKGPDIHWNYFKGEVRDNSERGGGVLMGFSERTHSILS